jgi:pyruvate dehydrogenase E1 component alpha subunit
MFGDGATNIGFFHEALNLSKVWNLPILWVCENNKYGMGTTVDRASAVPEIRQKAEGYNIPNDRINGMDVLEVRQASEKYLEYVREGNGPFFLEIVTYRFRGHSMGDPERYRQKEEVERWQKDDPIGIFRRYLLEQEIAKEGELDDLEMKVAAEVEDAVEFAESSPEPEPQALFEHIYADE